MIGRLSVNNRAMYAICSALILGPLLLPGYVLMLDTVWAPNIPMPTEVTSSYPLWALPHGLDHVLLSMLIQKVILFLILFLSGVEMHRLVQSPGDKPANAGARHTAQSPIEPYFTGVII